MSLNLYHTGIIGSVQKVCDLMQILCITVMMVITTHWKNRASLMGALIVNNIVILCWTRSSSIQGSQLSLTEEARL